MFPSNLVAAAFRSVSVIITLLRLAPPLLTFPFLRAPSELTTFRPPTSQSGGGRPAPCGSKSCCGAMGVGGAPLGGPHSPAAPLSPCPPQQPLPWRGHSIQAGLATGLAWPLCSATRCNASARNGDVGCSVLGVLFPISHAGGYILIGLRWWRFTRSSGAEVGPAVNYKLTRSEVCEFQSAAGSQGSECPLQHSTSPPSRPPTSLLDGRAPVE